MIKPSIFQQVLGNSFKQLHPKIQARFGLSSAHRTASIGTGIMHNIWIAKPYIKPLLHIGSYRNISIPQSGKNIPFTVENYPYIDSLGRESITWVRTFKFPNQTYRFDSTTLYSTKRNSVVDYLGTHQNLAVDIAVSVLPNRGIQLAPASQRLCSGPLNLALPPLIATGGYAREWYNPDTQKHHIEVLVSHKILGPLFGYQGSFTTLSKPLPTPSAIPNSLLPKKERLCP